MRTLVVLALLAVVFVGAAAVAAGLAFAVEVFAVVDSLLLVLFGRLAFQVGPVLAGFFVLA